MTNAPHVSVIFDAEDVAAAVVHLNPGNDDPFPVVRIAGVTLMAPAGVDLAAVLRLLAERVDELTNPPAAGEAGYPARVERVLDVESGDLVRLVVGLAEELEVYDPDAAEFDKARPVHRDLPGGAGLVPLGLDDHDLATLREVLSGVTDDLAAEWRAPAADEDPPAETATS